MDIIYVGSIVIDNEVQNSSGLSVAGNKMENGIVKYLARKDDRLFIVSIPPIAPFPDDVRICFKYKNKPNLSSNCIYISFINIPILKQISQIINTFLALRNVLRKCNNPILLSYNLFPQNGIPVILCNILYKCKLAAIIADPPIDQAEKRKLLIKILYNIYNKLCKFNIKLCKNLIVLNKEIINLYNSNASYIVLDGGIDECETKTKYFDFNQNKMEKNIVYSGSLTEYSGILRLIEAIRVIDKDDVCLHIYGSGPLENEIREIVKTENKIKYFGVVNNEEILTIQKKAWFLINPRIIDNQISRLTFPSKILEYLVSGTPIIATRLNGIGKEYERYLNYTDGDSVMDFVNIINKVYNEQYSYYIEKSKKGRRFAIKCKNWPAQSAKIRKYLSTI